MTAPLALLSLQATLASAAGAESLTHRMMVLALELAAILFAAKLAGELFERVFRQPAVLGELIAGIAIGPFALGGLSIPGLGFPLFPRPPEGAALPVSPELWAVAQLASIVLLFVVGLETDFRMFLRYSFPGLLVGMGGVLGAFVLGAWLPVALGRAASIMDPAALFLGTISVATSVGITARILSENRQLDSPEGTTILAAAVIDDVLGIIVLAIVGALATAAAVGGGAAVDWGSIGRIAAKAVGFWLGATALVVVVAATIARGLGLLRGKGSAAAVAFGLALLLAGLAESVGLAMIIGAYIVGLGLSKEKIAKELIADLQPIYHVLVPIFFCVMGMIVDIPAIAPALGFGALYTAVAIVAKIIGCGLPTLLVGFNLRGAIRVGVGMLPRGEVALIVAGAAIAHDPPYIGRDLFGVAILMTIATTLLAPPLIVASFARGGPGLRRAVPAGQAPAGQPMRETAFTIDGLARDSLPLVKARVIAAFEAAGFMASVVSTTPEIHGIVRGDTSVDLHEEGGALVFDCTVAGRDDVRALAAAGLEAARMSIAGARLNDQISNPQ